MREEQEVVRKRSARKNTYDTQVVKRLRELTGAKDKRKGEEKKSTKNVHEMS